MMENQMIYPLDRIFKKQNAIYNLEDIWNYDFQNAFRYFHELHYAQYGSLLSQRISMTELCGSLTEGIA